MYRMKQIGLFLLLTLTLYACDSEKKSENAATSSASSEQELSGKELARKKWNSYVFALNSLGTTLQTDLTDLFETSFGEVDWETPSSNVVSWANSLTSHEDKITSFEKALAFTKKEPVESFDSSMGKYLEAVIPLYTDITKLGKYIREKSYSKDGGDLGEELSKKISKQASDFLIVKEEFDKAMEKKSNTQRLYVLKEMEADGQVVLPKMLSLILQVEKMQGALSSMAGKSRTVLSAFSVDELLVFSKELTTQIEGLKNQASKETAEDEGILLEDCKKFLASVEHYKSDFSQLIEYVNKKKTDGNQYNVLFRDLEEKYKTIVVSYNDCMRKKQNQ